jgi:hypothetical protein
MNQLLATVPDDKPIPLATRDRLYELAWGVYYSGGNGKGSRSADYQFHAEARTEWHTTVRHDSPSSEEDV